jgi:hypothetical protein
MLVGLLRIGGTSDDRQWRCVKYVVNTSHKFCCCADGLPDWRRFTEDLFEITQCYFPVTFRVLVLRVPVHIDECIDSKNQTSPQQSRMISWSMAYGAVCCALCVARCLHFICQSRVECARVVIASGAVFD